MGKKIWYLCIREILVVTRPYVRPNARPSAPQAHQCEITQSTGMATQMQLKVLFGKKSHGRSDFWREKTTRKSSLISTLFLMFTLTWTTEKELVRVIEGKEDDFRWEKNKKIS